MAICRICGQKVKRGQGANVGTTALRQHMQRHHKVDQGEPWLQCGGPAWRSNRCITQ